MELLPIKKAPQRQRLERLIIQKNLSKEQIRQAVQEITQSTCEPCEEPTVIPVLAVTRKPHHRYGLVDPAKMPYSQDRVVVDCGFNLWRSLASHESINLGEASYTYPATVESVIDGDTLWAVIDCGFDAFLREKLRLRGIDTPELGTPAGDKAKQFVRRTLKSCPVIVIQTHKVDKYARHLSDIFYLSGCKDPQRIGSEGQLLNQTLLDKGLATVWTP